MKISLSTSELLTYLGRQLNNFFPDSGKDYFKMKDTVIIKAGKESLERLEYCFQHIAIKGYKDLETGNVLFNHLHSDQYSQFLYFFSNTLWKNTQMDFICSKLICLNKALNGCFYSYKAELPSIFLLVHPIGSVIGNANYEDFLVIYQNVTIHTPQVCDNLKLGKGLFLGAGAQIVGNLTVGDRVSIGAGTTLYKNEIVPDDYIIYRDNEGRLIKKLRKKEFCNAQKFFNVTI